MVTTVYPARMAESVKIPFGMMGRVGLKEPCITLGCRSIGLSAILEEMDSTL